MDSRHVLRGTIPLQTRMLSEPDVPVTGAFHEEEVTFTPDETVSDADRAFERYDLMTAPVVDDRGRLSAG